MCCRTDGRSNPIGGELGYQYHVPPPPSDGDDGSMYGDLPIIEGDFSLRAVVVGLGVGVILCMTNIYFGLQTGRCLVLSSTCERAPSSSFVPPPAFPFRH